MAETFESLLVALRRAGVDFLIAGGVAVCLNGYVRTTADLDLLVDVDPANIERLLGCLAKFGEGHARELSPADFTLEEGAIRVVEDFTIDVFTVMRSRRYDDFAGSARAIEVSGQTLRFLAPAALIELKSESHREKDQLDVAALHRILADESAATPIGLRDLSPEGAAEEDASA